MAKPTQAQRAPDAWLDAWLDIGTAASSRARNSGDGSTRTKLFRLRAGRSQYEALITKVKDDTLAAGKKLGGPFTWHDREGFSFFQASSEAALIRAGAKALLESAKGEYEY